MAEILDELAVGTDLPAKVDQAWRDFATALAEALPSLPAGGELDLTLDPTASGTGEAVYGATVKRHEGGTFVALAVGNASLPQGFRLDRQAIAQLVALGWSPPGVVDGSGRDFGLTAEAAENANVAVVVTRTLRDVYGAPHPAFVTFEARDDKDVEVVIPPLGSARALTHPESGKEGSLAPIAADATVPLPDRVAAIVASLLKTKPESLQVDSDGDIGVRSGSAMVFVRVRDNPALVDVISPVLTEVSPTQELFAKLSDLTHRMPIGRLYCADGTVWASIPVFGRDFQPSHLMLALQVMTGLTDELDDRLHGEFGGKRFFGDNDKPAIAAEPEGERTGMYL
jgi:hypothetical protein